MNYNNTRQLEQLVKCATDHEIFTDDMGTYSITLKDGTPISQIDIFYPDANQHGVFTLDLLEIVRDMIIQHMKKQVVDVYTLCAFRSIDNTINLLIEGGRMAK